MFRKVRKSLKILQIKIVLDRPAWVSWNCRGFRIKICHIKNLIYEVHPVYIALRENYLTPAVIAKIKGYNHVRKDNENQSVRASGGVALLVSHDTSSSAITLHTNLQSVVVRIMLSNLVTVCTPYLPPSISVDERVIGSLVEELPAPFIIGDFNCKSPLRAVRIQILVDGKLRNSLILTLFAYLTVKKIATSINEVELSMFWTSHYARRLFLCILTLELEFT
ncbi:hypothetical protein AVEN_216113-1 [Araneus ventricosus]|uniref:Endonuclease/exonuclease/phosphatase domain-containing protein n=1 Tax=Araneus ventricosus TaxID=182803 RepID=A0A4Y2M3X2_ARAVE|nr:hypothetical protein AVEN_216113-1 [Araneus ventricosus]